MLSRQPRCFQTPAESATNASYFVGDDRFAVSRSAKNDSAITFTIGHCLRRRANEQRVIDRLCAERTEIQDFVPERSQKCHYFFFVLKSGMIGTEDEFGNYTPEPGGDGTELVYNMAGSSRALVTMTGATHFSAYIGTSAQAVDTRAAIVNFLNVAEKHVASAQATFHIDVATDGLSAQENFSLPWFLQPTVVGMAATADGKGYWVASNNGTVWNFGDAAVGLGDVRHRDERFGIVRDERNVLVHGYAGCAERVHGDATTVHSGVLVLAGESGDQLNDRAGGADWDGPFGGGKPGSAGRFDRRRTVQIAGSEPA